VPTLPAAAATTSHTMPSAAMPQPAPRMSCLCAVVACRSFAPLTTLTPRTPLLRSPGGADFVDGDHFFSAAALGESKHNSVSVCVPRTRWPVSQSVCKQHLHGLPIARW